MKHLLNQDPEDLLVLLEEKAEEQQISHQVEEEKRMEILRANLAYMMNQVLDKWKPYQDPEGDKRTGRIMCNDQVVGVGVAFTHPIFGDIRFHVRYFDKDVAEFEKVLFEESDDLQAEHHRKEILSRFSLHYFKPKTGQAKKADESLSFDRLDNLPYFLNTCLRHEQHFLATEAHKEWGQWVSCIHTDSDSEFNAAIAGMVEMLAHNEHLENKENHRSQMREFIEERKQIKIRQKLDAEQRQAERGREKLLTIILYRKQKNFLRYCKRLFREQLTVAEKNLQHLRTQAAHFRLTDIPIIYVGMDSMYWEEGNRYASVKRVPVIAYSDKVESIKKNGMVAVMQGTSIESRVLNTDRIQYITTEPEMISPEPGFNTSNGFTWPVVSVDREDYFYISFARGGNQIYNLAHRDDCRVVFSPLLHRPNVEKAVFDGLKPIPQPAPGWVKQWEAAKNTCFPGPVTFTEDEIKRWGLDAWKPGEPMGVVGQNGALHNRIEKLFKKILKEEFPELIERRDEDVPF